jgi:hypothetical protein
MENKYKVYRSILNHIKTSNYIQMSSVFNMIQNYKKVNGADELFDKLTERYYIKLKEYENEDAEI